MTLTVLMKNGMKITTTAPTLMEAEAKIKKLLGAFQNAIRAIVRAK